MIARHAWPCVMVSWGLLCSGLAVSGTTASPVQAGRQQVEADSPQGPTLSPDGVRQLITDGKSTEAEQAARELLIQTERDSGPESVEAAEVLRLLAQALRGGGKGTADETLSVAERAVAIMENALRPDDVRLANALLELSNVHYERSEYAECRPLLERALAIYEVALGPDDVSVGDAHNNLGNLCQILSDLQEAESHHRTALQIYEKTLGPESDAVADSVQNLANTIENSRFDEAEALYQRSLAIRLKLYGEKHPNTASSYNNLGYHHLMGGQPELAKTEIERALAIREEVLPQGHPRLIGSLANLALTYWALGLPGGDGLWERAISLADTSLGRDSEMAASLRANYAVGLRDVDYQGAKRLREEALDIYERVYGPDHPRVSWVLGGLADDALLVGDYEAASQYLERAVRIDEKRLDYLDGLYANHLALLAQCRAETGRSTAARKLFDRSIEIAEQSGPALLEFKDILMRFGDFLRQSGDVEGARERYTRAIAVDQEKTPEGRPGDPSCLVALAGLEADAGNLDKARSLFELALTGYETRLETGTPPHSAALLRYSSCLLRAGEIEASLDMALRGSENTRRYLRSTIASLPERQALGLAARTQPGLEQVVSAAVAAPQPPTAARALDAVIQSRALVLDEIASRYRAAWLTGDLETERLVSAYVASSLRFAKLTVQGTDESFAERFIERLRTARREKEDAEQALAERNARFREAEMRSKAGLGEVAAALPPGSALVSFVRYPRQVAGPGASGARLPTDSYAAFVLRSGESTPALLDLGPASEIDGLIAALRTRVAQAAASPLGASAQSEAAYRRAGEALRRRVWDPLEPQLDGAGIVMIVPDGALNLVDLTALPARKSAYLIDTGPRVHYLSAERDLVAAEAFEGMGVLAVGDPSFDEGVLFAALRSPDIEPPEAPVRGASAQTYRGHPSSCGDFKSLHFASLPSSGLEVAEVASAWSGEATDTGRLLRGSEAAPQAQILEGIAANELAVKLAAPGKYVLHLATHGFFLGEGCPSALDASSDATGQPLPAMYLSENPLLLSGLALAGANHREAAGPDEDDGILTAQEIAAMNLSGVEWAVLSACDTGLGQIRAGEGVLGLRRAFQVAGARTVIMSLWPVEDEASRKWMRALYTNRMAEGMSTVDAVNAASLEQLRQRRDEGLSTHPFYWAGFVAAGDWR